MVADDKLYNSMGKLNIYTQTHTGCRALPVLQNGNGVVTTLHFNI